MQKQLSVGKASDYLGVSKNSVIRFTEMGLIDAFYTPGGHRRYTTVSLKKAKDKLFSKEPSKKSNGNGKKAANPKEPDILDIFVGCNRLASCIEEKPVDKSVSAPAKEPAPAPAPMQAKSTKPNMPLEHAIAKLLGVDIEKDQITSIKIRILKGQGTKVSINRYVA